MPIASEDADEVPGAVDVEDRESGTESAARPLIQEVESVFVPIPEEPRLAPAAARHEIAEHVARVVDREGFRAGGAGRREQFEADSRSIAQCMEILPSSWAVSDSPFMWDYALRGAKVRRMLS
jgi:hypothetical protein